MDGTVEAGVDEESPMGATPGRDNNRHDNHILFLAMILLVTMLI
jgi:hypothetical protein